jgi:hypothetical protein
MPESIFEIEQIVTNDDAEAVMFELQDLPCVNQADVDLVKVTVREPPSCGDSASLASSAA